MKIKKLSKSLEMEPSSNENIKKNEKLETPELLSIYDNSDNFEKLNLKIQYKETLKDLNWPIIKDDNNYEFSYNKHSGKTIYYYYIELVARIQAWS